MLSVPSPSRSIAILFAVLVLAGCSGVARQSVDLASSHTRLADALEGVSARCRECWRNSCEGAPSDGFAWMIDGEDLRPIYWGGTWSSPERPWRSPCRGLFIDLRLKYVGFRPAADPTVIKYPDGG